MIVLIERKHKDGTVARFCITAYDKNEAELKVKDMNVNDDYVYKIVGYEYCDGMC
jgi:hypothetical protein